jgi:hypothetical protein
MRSMILAAVLIALPAMAAAQVLERPDHIACNAELRYSCKAGTCQTDGSPASIDLDFAAGTALFCDGGICRDGSLASIEADGMVNQLRHVVFSISGRDVAVTGALSLQSMDFSAESGDSRFFGDCGAAD